MRTSRILNFALAVAVASAAGSAGAQVVTRVNADVTTPTTWCDNEDEMFLDKPIFVSSKLTILPGCIIRGNPRTQPFNAQTPTVGAPGALIISQDGFLDAQGTATNPIIMTTGASDANNDGNADDNNNGPLVQGVDGWNGTAAFLDNTPKTNPLAPLDQAGNSTSGLWGGLVLLGRAPTNLGENTTFGYGSAGIEGLAIPGFPATGARYGGYQPHDSSGILRYVSIRHAGDEIGAGNELNGLTLGGVGDGTIIENVEIFTNFDDGVEFFGGTVNVRNLLIAHVGDDSVDIDQGYSGNLQNVLVLQNFFNTNSGGLVGTVSGDAIGEWDGDDCDPCNIQIDSVSSASPTVPQSWPNAHPALYNMTAIGAQNLSGGANPAVSPFAGTRGLRLRNGFTGAVLNSIITNTPLPCNVDANAGSHEADVIRLVATTIADSAAPNAACTTAINNGNTAVNDGEYDGGSANFPTVSGDLLVRENHYYNPQGVVVGGRGKLAGSKVGLPADPRPASPANANVSGGVKPRGDGLDATATYRGAFPASQPLWTTGWTALNTGGILAD